MTNMKCPIGKKQKGKKCVSVFKSISFKKSYNPFKMWGSYVGFSLAYILIFIAQSVTISKSGLLPTINFSPNYFISLVAIPYAIGGFLIGWGIHSLFRRFR